MATTYTSSGPEAVGYGGGEGVVLGQSATDKVGFYGTTPAAQRASSAQAEFTITIGTSETCWGFKTSDQFNAFVLQLREIENTLTALGLWKGGA